MNLSRNRSKSNLELSESFYRRGFMEFDKIIHKTLDEESVDYGFIFGNNKIVFIKAGAGGGIPGYQDKYLRMAHRVHERLGATVICSSNYEKSLPTDKKAIEWCARYLKPEDAELYFVGVSDGADQCITLSRNAPTKKLLCINPSFVPGHDPSDRLIIRSKVEKIFVYGTKDEEGQELASRLLDRKIPNFEIRWVEGADHDFTGMVDEFVSLIDFV
jgi:hypothetical protein